MAIESFKKVQLLAHRSVRDELLARLQRLGVLDLTTLSALPRQAGRAEEERALEALLRRVDDAIRDLGRHLPAVRSRQRPGAVRPAYTEAGLEELSSRFDTAEFLAEIEKIRGRREADRIRKTQLDEEQRRLEFWKSVDLPLDRLRPTRQVGVLCGRVRAADLERFRRDVTKAGGVHFPGGGDDRFRSKVVFFHRAGERAVREALAGAGFQPADLPPLPVTPAERLAAIEAERHALREAAYHDGTLLTYLAGWYLAGWSDDLLAQRDLLAGRLERLRAQRQLGETSQTVSIEGWVPARLLEGVRAEVTSRFRLAGFEVSEPAPTDRVPVLLANSWLLRPFESIVELYGLPRYGGIDPTTVLGFFFAIFFGLCLTDAGYGIMLALAAGIAMVFTPAAVFPERRRLLALFTLGGLATVIAGAAAGGWFGVSVRWKLFDPLQELMLFFALALVLGALHLFAGLGLRMAHQMRRGQVLAPLLDQGLWIVLVAPLLALLGVRAGKIPAALGPALSFAALAAALGIVCFQGRGEPAAKGREWPHHLLWGGIALALAAAILGHGNPWSWIGAGALFAGEIALLHGRVGKALARIGLGLYALYGISGYMSDILSYSRLVALGLGSGTVAMIVNTMAAQATGLGWSGWVLAALIFVVGHVFNLAINLLGAFVHSCRLQYVEFFTKFYESGGRPYAPFRWSAKHVTITEEARSG